jgi:hypothetical protein
MKILISLFILIVLLSSCWGVIECPTYPENKKSWIPYEVGDGVRFSDGIDTIVIRIEHSYSTSDFFIEKYSDDECICYASFRSDNNSLGPSFSGGSFYNGYFVSYYYDFYIPDDSLNNANGILSPMYPGFNFQSFKDLFDVEKLDEYTAADKTYADVLLLELDTVLTFIEHDDFVSMPIFQIPQVWRIAIADSVGLIQFEDRVNRKTWNLVDKVHFEPTVQ